MNDPQRQRALDLLDYYHKVRVVAQSRYYRHAWRRFKRRDIRLQVLAGVLLLTVAPITTLGDIFREQIGDFWQVVILVSLTVIPAAATAVQTLRGTFRFQSIQHLYRRSYFDLGEIADAYDLTPEGPALVQTLEDYIDEVEAAITEENREWRGERAKIAPRPVDDTPGT
jgi:hypothetical protein